MPTNIEAPERIWMSLNFLKDDPDNFAQHLHDDVEYIRAPATQIADRASILEEAARECEFLLESQLERTSDAGAGSRVAIRACIAVIRALARTAPVPLAEDRVEAEKIVATWESGRDDEFGLLGSIERIELTTAFTTFAARVRAGQRERDAKKCDAIAAWADTEKAKKYFDEAILIMTGNKTGAIKCAEAIRRGDSLEETDGC